MDVWRTETSRGDWEPDERWRAGHARPLREARHQLAQVIDPKIGLVPRQVLALPVPVKHRAGFDSGLAAGFHIGGRIAHHQALARLRAQRLHGLQNHVRRRLTREAIGALHVVEVAQQSELLQNHPRGGRALGSGGAFAPAQRRQRLRHAGIHAGFAVVDASRTKTARWRVHHAKGEELVQLSQRWSSGFWVYLGTFDFAEGNAGWVKLSSAADGSVSADAVKFVFTDVVPPPWHGVIRVDTNGRYFEFEDGTPFLPIGHNFVRFPGSGGEVWGPEAQYNKYFARMQGSMVRTY